MARIRFYPEDNNLHPSDHIVGTDEVTGGGATRVFTVEALTEYLRPLFTDAAPIDISAGIVPVADGNGGWSASNILQKSTTVETGSIEKLALDGTVELFSDNVGTLFMEIQDNIPGGFDIAPRSLISAGSPVTFSTTGPVTTGTVEEFIGYVEPIGPSNAPGAEPVFRFRISSTSGITTGGVFPESITFSGSELTEVAVCITGSTVNVGNLDIGGVIRVGGVEVDLRQIPINTDNIGLNTDAIQQLELNKADVTDLHPAATIPDPTPSIPGDGFISTAITEINIDPATQVITVERGRVPIVIGGDDSGTGTFSVNSITTEGINVSGSEYVNIVASGGSTEVTTQVVIDSDLLPAVRVNESPTII